MRDPDMQTDASGDAVQRVVKVRRDYNAWVVRETLEDYALRFTPRSFRKWSELHVANTAFGAASFLVLEAVGATLLVDYGFTNALWAILATGLVIFLAGWPISRYAARHGVDMDLLTRGAGFGYIGSTLTSLVYACFTFIFFALEAAIMAYALELYFHIPPVWGYLLCALVVIPLVTHGVTSISRLQAWTQPLWLLLLVLPYAFLLWQEPGVLHGLFAYPGSHGEPDQSFTLPRFAAAFTVGIALITQMGEQVDYLRFMPQKPERQGWRWQLGVMLGGPGWVLLGVPKMLGGMLLAWLALRNGVAPDKAVDPNQMYLIGFSHVFEQGELALAITAIFVIISQLKINVTNAYAGSLAWSNFFARLTHSHPGRVVWVIFNTLIALMLMELEVFQALGKVLALYANIAIAWMMAVVADLVINKPLGLSPPGIEFRRSHLYDINPVGVGAMGLASLLAMAAHLGLFGADWQPFSAFIALGVAFVTAPLLAWLTGGRYYLARSPESRCPAHVSATLTGGCPACARPPGEAHASTPALTTCTICERAYEAEDMAFCPAYQGPICSLCCSLDARCQDLCKPDARLAAQWQGLLARCLPRRVLPYLETGLGHYLLLLAVMVPFLGVLFGLLYYHELPYLAALPDARVALQSALLRAFAILLLVSAIAAWWLVLTSKSRQVAQAESNRQTHLLMQEIESHRRTDEQLQKARQVAEQANQAKSRYINAISHELRTPLNSILGYAQIMAEDEQMPPKRQQAVSVIRRSGEHLLSLIEGTLDVARIESGKLRLEVRPVDFPALLQQLVGMFDLQARNKGLYFHYEATDSLPAIVRADEKRLRQILINILGNAIKFTIRGGVALRVQYRREMAVFEIEDSGPGIPAAEIGRIFEPFERGAATHVGAVGGTGLGLTISKMLTDLMGGELQVSSTPGQGSCFRVRLFLPQVHGSPLAVQPRQKRIGYLGPRRQILVVDNEREDRELLQHLLEPLGFTVRQAASGDDCLAQLQAIRTGAVAATDPDLIFMDLAMPGLDGWETIRRIRAGQLSRACIAIVSANAFDRGLDNDVALAPEDFITKPIRVEELLDWLGQRLQLEWLTALLPAPAPPPERLASQPPRPVYPDTATLRSLNELIDLGYVRGINSKLAEVEAAGPQYAEFVRLMRSLARQFQFDAMKTLLHQQWEDPDHDDHDAATA